MISSNSPVIYVEIANWDKYNPRTNAKRYSWFRFEAGFFGDEDLRDLSGPHLLVFIYLCCARTKGQATIAEIKIRHCATNARTTDEDVRAAVKILAERGLIILHDGPLASANEVVPTRTTSHDNVRPRTKSRLRTNVRTNERDNPPPASPDPTDLALADEWVDFARSRSDTARPNRDAYAKAVAQMRGLGLSPQDVRDTLAWIRGSDFWVKVAWSPVQLVKSKDGSRKLDTVRAQMAKTKPVAKTSTPFLTLEEIDALDRG
jgi:hypothetical protein